MRIDRADSDFQYVETLRRNRAKRQKSRAFFVEGVRSINAMVRARWSVEGLYYAYDRPLSDWAKGILEKAGAANVFELAGELMARLSQKEDPSELVAVGRMPADDPDRIAVRGDLLVVLMDRPTSPGNLGTMIRSCDALGAHGVLVTGHATDVYEPETIRASAGSLFALPVVRLPSHREVMSWTAGLRDRIAELQMVGLSARADRALHTGDFSGPTIVCLGNEKWGLSKNYRADCDVLLRIPMPTAKAATSLNVACAGTTVLYEVQRQRLVDGP